MSCRTLENGKIMRFEGCYLYCHGGPISPQILNKISGQSSWAGCCREKSSWWESSNPSRMLIFLFPLCSKPEDPPVKMLKILSRRLFEITGERMSPNFLQQIISMYDVYANTEWFSRLWWALYLARKKIEKTSNFLL